MGWKVIIKDTHTICLYRLNSTLFKYWLLTRMEAWTVKLSICFLGLKHSVYYVSTPIDTKGSMTV